MIGQSMEITCYVHDSTGSWRNPVESENPGWTKNTTKLNDIKQNISEIRHNMAHREYVKTTHPLS